MREDTYLVPKNGTCPICHGTLYPKMTRMNELGYACNDCKSKFYLEGNPKYGCINDMLLRKE